MISFTLTDADEQPFVMPLNGNIEWRMAQTAHDIDTDCIVRKDLVSGGVLLEDNIAEVALTRFDTTVPSGVYYHQLSILDFDTGDTAVAATGNVLVRQSLQMPQAKSGGAALGAGGALIVNATKI